MVYLILDDFWLVEMYEFPYNELLWFITTKNQSGCRNNIVSVQRIVMVYLKTLRDHGLSFGGFRTTNCYGLSHY